VSVAHAHKPRDVNASRASDSMHCVSSQPPVNPLELNFSIKSQHHACHRIAKNTEQTTAAAARLLPEQRSHAAKTPAACLCIKYSRRVSTKPKEMTAKTAP
jgi:hypothetical protein